MKVALLLSFISINTYALDCAGMPEGKVIRLDQNNGPLAKAAVQDQDGIGSCYANQASVMLQSVIPGNPDLSYLNLGLYHATDFTIPKERAKGRKFYTNTVNANPYIDGGFSCKTINSALARQQASGNGVLCKSEDVLLEHGFINERLDMGINNQNSALKVSASYMNSYQSTFGFADETDATKIQAKRAKADAFQKALTNFVNVSGDTYFTKKCSSYDSKKILSAIEGAFTRAINNNPQCISGKTISTTTPLCQTFAQFGSIVSLTNSGDKSSKISFLQTKESRDKISSALPGLLKSQSGMKDFLSGIGSQIKNSDKSKKSEQEKTNFAQMIMQNISPEAMRDVTSDYERIALKKYDKCKAQNVLAFFMEKDTSDKIAKDAILCNYKGLLNEAKHLAMTLPENSFNNMNTFIDFITKNAGLEYDQAMLSLIANDCSPDKRVKIPSSLKCEQVVMNFNAGDFNFNSSAPSSPAAIEVIKKNRVKMLASIDEKKAFGISVCTKFWKDPNYRYNAYPTRQQRAETCVNGKDSFHAMAAIGYRCKNNKIQYLAQNSWGTNWKEDQNKSLEIENGKMWLDEDVLFQNLETLDFLSI